MRSVCQQKILMKYHALFVIFEKAAQLKLSSAANYRWSFEDNHLVIEVLNTLHAG